MTSDLDQSLHIWLILKSPLHSQITSAYEEKAGGLRGYCFWFIAEFMVKSPNKECREKGRQEDQVYSGHKDNMHCIEDRP